MRPAIPTQTPDTQSFYQRVIGRLERHAAEMVVAGEMVYNEDRNLRIAIAFTDLEPKVTVATARLYRAAVRHAMATSPGDFDHDVDQILDPEHNETWFDRQEQVRQERAANLTELRGAQQKARWIPMTDWAKLNAALRASGSVWAEPACSWIGATLVTGLRPCEWRGAQLVDKALVVCNAKQTNGRAHSETRTIGLARCPREDIDLVSGFLSRVKLAGDEYEAMYDGVRELIRIVARRTFPGRTTFPSLYTARHCFAARAKSTYTKAGVAALMGHASTDTAGRHYAQARHARGGRPLDVEPSNADITAVRQAKAARALLET